MDHQPTAEFPDHLRELYRRFPFDRSLAQDPLSCVRPLAVDRRSAEVAGIFASTLAIGNTTAIRGAFGRLLDLVHGDLRSFIAGSSLAQRRRALRRFRHRWIRGDQMAELGSRLSEIYGSFDSLEDVFLEGFRGDRGFAGGLHELAHSLRGAPSGNGSPGSSGIPRGYQQLFPSPLEAPRSPCKRLTLYVRWMVRHAYPDLGVWGRIPTAELRVPLDQHVYWIAYHLGLTRRRTRTWATVEEVTNALRRIDPIDPVKYDFVLCHTGISGDCPKERDMTVCGPCVVRPDCLLWRTTKAAG